MMCPADVAIAGPHLGHLHQFGSVDLNGASSIWGTDGRQMVPNQDCREDGEESPSAKCSGGSLRCEQCVARHYHATAVLTVTAIQVSCNKQPP
jgi:hypothetical protein